MAKANKKSKATKNDDAMAAIESARVIEELIQLAQDMREANTRGEALGLSEEELAFYDALETNDSVVKLLGDETLCAIARELVETVRSNVTIDRDSLRTFLDARHQWRHFYLPESLRIARMLVKAQRQAAEALLRQLGR